MCWRIGVRLPAVKCFLYALLPYSYCELLILTVDVPSLPILVTLIMEAINSSETSVLTRAPRRNIPEDDILRIPYFHNFLSF
jgi:hypothetical protein